MADQHSVTTVVVGERLPWPEDHIGPCENGPFDSGAIYRSGERLDCTIRKVSSLGVTLGSDIAPILGERILVELVTGQRPAGRIAWAKDKEVGVRFDDTIDVVALLNRKLVSQTSDRRTMPRIDVRCPVHVKWNEHFAAATLRNISANGLQLEGDDLPALGTFVSVFAEGLNIPPGELMWRRGRLAGVEVLQELSWSSIIPWVRSQARGKAQ